MQRYDWERLATKLGWIWIVISVLYFSAHFVVYITK